MTAPVSALTRPSLAATWRAWRVPAISMGVGLTALALLFSAEIAAAIRTWASSTAYNHCFLVIPIVIWLLWERRADLRGLRAKPMPLACLAGLPLAVAWLGAERLGIMEGRQLVAISFVEVMILAILGRKTWSAASGPLLYLYFLVPFGEFLVPKLQDVTTAFTRHGLGLLHIPAFINGYTIEIPEGTFYVAEACAGLRFLIASVAFGCLYALIMYRGAWRRAGFIAVSIVVPVIANGFRALGIVVLGHVLGSAQAAATDHVLYGWIFFSLVILLLIGLGLPFREDEERPSTPVRVPLNGRPGTTGWTAITAVLGAVAVAAIGPAVAAEMNQAVMLPALAVRRLDPGPGCSTLVVPQQAMATPGLISVHRIACGAAVMDVTIETFSPRTTAGPIMAERHRLTRLPQAEDTVEDWLDGTPRSLWRVIRASEPAAGVAVGLWVGGEPVRIGIPMRLEMALTSLTGGGGLPVLATVAPAVDWQELTAGERQRAVRRLTDFLLSHPDLGPQLGQ